MFHLASTQPQRMKATELQPDVLITRLHISYIGLGQYVGRNEIEAFIKLMVLLNKCSEM